MHPGLTILAVVLAFLFSFLAIQIGAVTDQTPLTAAAKASQLIFGGATSGQGLDIIHAQKLNLVAGSLASGGAGVATDLTSDFRTGFLIGTPPVKQWIAQAIGTFISVWLAPGLFVLFTSAYPCIYDPNLSEEHCAFLVPSVTAWAAVARAVTDPKVSIPLSSGMFAIAMGLVSIAQVVFRHYYLVGPREKYQKWLPNWGAIALSWVIPAPVFANAALVGAIAAALWRKYSFRTWELYGYAVAAGTSPPFVRDSSIVANFIDRLHRWRGSRRCRRRRPHACERRRRHQGHPHRLPVGRVLALYSTFMSRIDDEISHLGALFL
jgi:uncharacterized oligopeptide transporter (OPT) family protein